MLGNKVRNIIDNNDDKDTVTKTTGQLASAGVWFSKKAELRTCVNVASYDMTVSAIDFLHFCVRTC